MEPLANFSVPTSVISHRTRAVYYPTEDGGLRLARVESFSRPFFRDDGWENVSPHPSKVELDRDSDAGLPASHERANLLRAVRRAKQNAFDAIMCNQDMDLFVTFTYAPEKVEDKSNYKECYKYLNSFLSNRVQRRGLKYVCVPELTKKGDVHFHMICNSVGVGVLKPATNPHTGRDIIRHGKLLYNLAEWPWGFSTAEYITDLECDGTAYDRVAKYIFKYIGKDLQSKIGGRYVLMGGVLARPVYVHGDTPDEFSTDNEPRYVKHVDVFDGLAYDAKYYI